jgi:3-hydroxypropanoate dehydrogenase
MQPMRIVAVRSPAAKSQLVEAMSPRNRDTTAGAPLNLIVAADLDFHEHIPTIFPHAPQIKDNFADAEARRTFATSQTWLQLGYLIVAIRAAGLAAGPMAGFDRAAIDALIGPGLATLAVVNVGHPGEDAWMGRLPRHDEDVALRVI